MSTDTRMAKRAAFSAFAGSTVEYYDFVVFATASALVFNKVFFEALGAQGSILAALASFGVAYAARPIGAIIFGTLGDRVGRRRVLTLVLIIMGTATFLVGCIPSYAASGAFGPIALVVLRIVQGLSAGAEQGGSNSLSLEHAPQGKRGLYTSWTMQGTTFGTLIASAIFIPITQLPKDQLLSWGWRLPFWIAGVLIIVAFLIRRGVAETNAFTETRTRKQLVKAPVLVVLRDYWPNLLRIIGCSLLAVSGSILFVFALSYATHTVGVDATSMLVVTTLAGFIGLVAQPVWAALSDRVGRRPVFIGSMIATGILFFPMFFIIAGANMALIFVAFSVVSIAATGANSVGASLYTEMFDTRVRYTGVALGTQLGFIVAGFAPTIAGVIEGKGVYGWVPVAIFAACCMFVAGGSAWTARETRGAELDELGHPAVPPDDRAERIASANADQADRPKASDR